jgi:chromosomal replication initiation ATPase DnaA
VGVGWVAGESKKRLKHMITIEYYSSRTGIPADTLSGKSRKFHTALAREIYWLYLRKNGFTYKKIAQMFDRKRHTTALSGIKRAKNMLLTKEKPALFYIEALNMKPDEIF